MNFLFEITFAARPGLKDVIINLQIFSLEKSNLKLRKRSLGFSDEVISVFRKAIIGRVIKEN